MIQDTLKEGNRFEKLTCVSPVKTRKGIYRWLCKCECGNSKVILIRYLINGIVTSCGCSQRLGIEEVNKSHGMAKKTPLYGIWIAMRSRCNNKNASKYHLYGGRGITICERWNNFQNFYDDMFPTYKEGLSIDRIDNNGNYEPTNCRWATQKEQCSNQRKNRILSCNGITATLSEFSRLSGNKKITILTRLKYGWDVYDAIYSKPNPHRTKHKKL